MQTKLSGLLFLCFSIAFFSCADNTKTKTTATVEEHEVQAKDEKKKLLRHVVVFKFKDSSTKADVSSVNDAFAALAGKIPAIKDFEWGINNSPEGLDQNFTHCYLVTFESERDRDSVYLPHPDHQAFVANLQPHLEKVFVVDYWTNP